MKRSPEEPPYYLVTAALIPSNGRLFIAQRPPNKKFGLHWEFPGGKAQMGESLDACLFREIKEELNWEIEVGELFQHIQHQHDDFRIELYAFWSRIRGGHLELREHVACSWARIAELRQFDFTKADRQLITCLEELTDLPDYA
jgi:8-oxo-dGTP diphosphatase